MVAEAVAILPSAGSSGKLLLICALEDLVCISHLKSISSMKLFYLRFNKWLTHNVDTKI